MSPINELIDGLIYQQKEFINMNPHPESNSSDPRSSSQNQLAQEESLSDFYDDDEESGEYWEEEEENQPRRTGVVALYLSFALGLIAVGIILSFVLIPDFANKVVSAFSNASQLWPWPVNDGNQEDDQDSSGDGAEELAAQNDRATSFASLSPLVSESENLEDGRSGEFSSFSDSTRQVRGPDTRSKAISEGSVIGARPRNPRHVREKITGLGPSIQQCYERRMRTKGRLRGVLEVALTVNPSGMASNVRLGSRSSLRDPGLLSCLRSRISSIRFGRGPSENYSVPIRFVPSDGH